MLLCFNVLKSISLSFFVRFDVLRVTGRRGARLQVGRLRAHEVREFDVLDDDLARRGRIPPSPRAGRSYGLLEGSLSISGSISSAVLREDHSAGRSPSAGGCPARTYSIPFRIAALFRMGRRSCGRSGHTRRCPWLSPLGRRPSRRTCRRRCCRAGSAAGPPA